eukprot:gene15882-17482_t
MVQGDKHFPFSINDILSPDFDKNRRTSSRQSKTDKTSKRKSRTKFTSEQMRRLEESFARETYLTLKEVDRLADELNLEENCIRTWFQNRRTKMRRVDNQPIFDENQPTFRIIPDITRLQCPLTGHPAYFRPQEQFIYCTGSWPTYYHQQQACYSTQQSRCGDSPWSYHHADNQVEGRHFKQEAFEGEIPYSVAASRCSEEGTSSSGSLSPDPSERLSHFPTKRRSVSPFEKCAKKQRPLDSVVPTRQPEQQRPQDNKRKRGVCKLNPIIL